MAADACLSAKHAPLANLGAAGYAHLGAHDGVAAYLTVMAYLYQIV